MQEFRDSGIFELWDQQLAIPKILSIVNSLIEAVRQPF
jgi:hypothetical protein